VSVVNDCSNDMAAAEILLSTRCFYYLQLNLKCCIGVSWCPTLSGYDASTCFSSVLLGILLTLFIAKVGGKDDIVTLYDLHLNHGFHHLLELKLVIL